MTVPEFIIFLLLGRLVIWLAQTNGLTRPIWELHPKLEELAECDLCLGFWIYLMMAGLVGQSTLFAYWPPVIDYLAQAAGAAFVAHLLRLGWHSKFGITVV